CARAFYDGYYHWYFDVW
nr:immunoglobulin heavy chain junction region [Mus musculus]